MGYVIQAVVVALAASLGPAPKSDELGASPPLANMLPALDAKDHLVRDPEAEPAWKLPIAVPAFEEHVRNFDMTTPEGTILGLAVDKDSVLHVVTATGSCHMQADGSWVQDGTTAMDPQSSALAQTRLEEGLGLLPAAIQATLSQITKAFQITALATDGASVWFADGQGLCQATPGAAPQRQIDYGDKGPASNTITALACDSKGTLWVGTPVGLSRRSPDGAWSTLRGKDGLPVESVTALDIDGSNRLWIGTERGLVQYRPYETGRQWFYRAGKRYLPGDHVKSVAVSSDGKTVYTVTTEGLGRLDVTTTTLLGRAQTIERLVEERHRRMGLVASCNLDNAEHPTSHTIDDNDNDGLWTAYHVAAMALCYGATGDEAAKASASEGMHALYMLQNASGIPGLVARSVVPPEIGRQKDLDRPEPNRQWRPTPDGAMYWKSDTSSDEIDGHYFAFYTYYEHVAKNDPVEKKLLEKQVRDVTDYLISHNYQLIDWDGERTRWGFWNPEALNGNAGDYAECGLNSLQMLSFLKVAHYVTGDPRYAMRYRELILKHGYLSNVQLSKKLFPDENNHSDDQLGFVAWYPILQLEHDPVIRNVLHAAVRRHYKVVAPESPSFYAFVYATVAPNETALDAAIENLRQIPTDRRSWRAVNSDRDDVHFSSGANRFGRRVLDRVLPVDERAFEKWNGDPYVPDGGDGGQSEDDGAAFLLPYWMGRYHGLIAEPQP